MLTNICVFVSGGGTNLQALIDAQKSGIIKSGRISLVISDKKDAYALVRAKENGIKTRVLIKKKAESKDEYEDRIEAVLRENDIDLIVLAGFMRILSGRFTGRHKNRIINVHPALIPSFCGEGFFGLKVHEAALAYGVKVSGATVHFVNEVPDGGQIIYQKAVEVQDGDTPEILQKRIMEQAEWILLPKACELVSHKIQTGEL